VNSVDLAVNAAGYAFAVWDQNDGTHWNVWANRYVPGVGWEAPEVLEAFVDGDCEIPRVAIDPDGNATAVWTYDDGVLSRVYASQYVVGSGWAYLPEAIDAGTSRANRPQVSVDAHGHAIAVWTESSAPAVMATRYVAGSGWGTPDPID